MQLTATNTAVVLDSTADFPEGPQRFPNWRVVPLYVRFGAESFRDYAELGPQEFYERLRIASDLPTTSQPTPGDFLEVYRGLERYERILSLHIPATLSGTVESARLAGGELGGGKVRAIDSGTVSAGLAPALPSACVTVLIGPPALYWGNAEGRGIDPGARAPVNDSNRAAWAEELFG